jgi:AraC-like DNA-binding protein
LWRGGAALGYPDSDKAAPSNRPFDTVGRGPKNGRMTVLGISRTFRTRSVHEAREHVAGVFAAHRLACGARELDFIHDRTDRPRLSLNRLRYGADVVVDAPALERFYLLQMTLAGSCEVELARRTVTVREGELLVINPTLPYRKRWRADCAQLIARLDRGLVEEAWTALHGAAPARPLEFAFANLPATAVAGLAGALRRMHADATTDRQLADALVASLPPAESDAACGAAALIVRRAEAFMAAHLAVDLPIGEIAQAAGTTPRTLERAFRRERQATAVAQLRAMRLERARAALLAPRRSGCSVTDIATAVGLVHPGRFAADYRRRFGDAPSETLRRADHERSPQ